MTSPRCGIPPPDVMPRATAHIEDMVRLIETLIEKGHAYRTDDGSVFFRIASWPAYGRLARLDAQSQRPGERVEADEYDKDDVRDFALWKAAKPGEPSWETSLGAGRPGWHIECSAMSMRYLGPTFDLHTGGIDLVFPHHEDEIAQSEAATGQPFVHTWLHCAHLHMGGEKMAKRAGNFARPADVYAAGISPRALRYALLATHYRSPLEFSETSLAAAGAAVERLDTAVAALDGYAQERADDPIAAATCWPMLGRPSPTPLATTSTSRRRWRPSSTSFATSTRGSRVAACRPPMRVEPPPRCVSSTACSACSRRRPLRWTRPCSSSSRRAPWPVRRATGPAATSCATHWRLRACAVEDTADGQRWRRVTSR